jgi:hypothetical protein
MGSITTILGKKFSLEKVSDLITNNFAEIFGYEIEKANDIDSLISEPAEV